jgi:hypothetical protein
MIRDHRALPVVSFFGSFFFLSTNVRKLDRTKSNLGLVELGCGYGHFKLPAARTTKRRRSALEIDPEMVTTISRTSRTP